MSVPSNHKIGTRQIYLSRVWGNMLISSVISILLHYMWGLYPSENNILCKYLAKELHIKAPTYFCSFQFLRKSGKSEKRESLVEKSCLFRMLQEMGIITIDLKVFGRKVLRFLEQSVLNICWQLQDAPLWQPMRTVTISFWFLVWCPGSRLKKESVLTDCKKTMWPHLWLLKFGNWSNDWTR